MHSDPYSVRYTVLLSNMSLLGHKKGGTKTSAVYAVVIIVAVAQYEMMIS